jgi:thiol-disulfide isomerase/thioredoxin
LTGALSAAAILGYLTYRLALDGPGDDTAAAPESMATGEPAAALADALPNFTLDDLEGTPTPITSLTGKPMLINFWATWCAPCLREIPMLKEFQTANEDAVQVVGIAVDRRDPVLSFAEEMDFNYPILVGQAEAMDAAAGFGVNVFALPFTVFTDASGAVLGVHTGEIHAEHLANLRAVLDDLGAGAIDRATARARLAGAQ